MKKKNLNTLVEDIYKSLEPLAKNKPLKIKEKDLDDFAEDMKEALKGWAFPEEKSKNILRMSNIGKPERQLWFDARSEVKDQIRNENISEDDEEILDKLKNENLTQEELKKIYDDLKKKK